MSRRRRGERLEAERYTKANLPEKTCVVCDRPFMWRKKWADCWDKVKYCSDRCRRRRHQAMEKP